MVTNCPLIYHGYSRQKRFAFRRPFAYTPRHFRTDLGAACFWRGRSLRPSGLEPASGAAVAAPIPSFIRVIYNCLWYDILRTVIFSRV